MARARRGIDFDTEIMKVDAQITRWKKTIIELEEKRKELLNAKREAEINALYDAIQRSGRTVDDVLSLLNPTPPNTRADFQQFPCDPRNPSAYTSSPPASNDMRLIPVNDGNPYALHTNFIAEVFHGQPIWRL